MATASERFPVTYPAESWHFQSNAATLRRLLKVAVIGPGARVLHWGAGRGEISVFLAQELGLHVIAAEWEPAALTALTTAAKASTASARIQVLKLSKPDAVRLDKPVEAILVEERIPVPFRALLDTARPLLVEKGRLLLRYPVGVRRAPDDAANKIFAERIGEPLETPRDLLRVATDRGFASEAIETASISELDSFYAAVEAGLANAPSTQRPSLLEEIALSKEASRNPPFSWSRLIVRRKEPGEKPPTTRTE